MANVNYAFWIPAAPSRRRVEDSQQTTADPAGRLRNGGGSDHGYQCQAGPKLLRWPACPA